MTKEQNMIKEYLEWQNIPFEIETDVPFLMKFSKGKMNPNFALGFWVFPNGQQRTLITGFYQAVDWVSSNVGRYC